MKLLRKPLIVSVVCVSSVAFSLLKITYCNPAWSIGEKYPNATIQTHAISTPDLYFWSSLARFFNISMTDPDHYLAIHIKEHSSDLSLIDFIEAEELYVESCSITDISGFLLPSSKLKIVVFTDCDFSKLPFEQRRLLIKDRERFVLLDTREK